MLLELPNSSDELMKLLQIQAAQPDQAADKRRTLCQNRGRGTARRFLCGLLRQHARSGIAGACEAHDTERFDGFDKNARLVVVYKESTPVAAVSSSGLKIPWKTPGPLPCGNSAACRPTCCCTGPCWPSPVTTDTAFLISTLDAG